MVSDDVLLVQNMEARQYIPYTKSGSDELVVKINKSSQITVSEKVYGEFLQPAKRVNLFFLNGEGASAIGIRAARESEGLTLISNLRVKGKIISARGFLAQFGLKDLIGKFPVEYDADHKMVIARLAYNRSTGETVEELDDEVNNVSRAPIASYQSTLLNLIPFATSGKEAISKAQLDELLARVLGQKLPRRGSRALRAFQSRIHNTMKKFLDEGKIRIAHKKSARGGDQPFYFRVN